MLASMPLCKNKLALHDTSRWGNFLDDRAAPHTRFWREMTASIYQRVFNGIVVIGVHDPLDLERDLFFFEWVVGSANLTENRVPFPASL